MKTLRARRREACRSGWSKLRDRRVSDDDIRWEGLGPLLPGRRDGGWPLPHTPADGPVSGRRPARWEGTAVFLWGLAASDRQRFCLSSKKTQGAAHDTAVQSTSFREKK
jgi:hypothetical protein